MAAEDETPGRGGLGTASRGGVGTASRAEDESTGAEDGTAARNGVETAGRSEDEAAGREGVGTAGRAEEGTAGRGGIGTAGRGGVGTAGRAEDEAAGRGGIGTAGRAGDETAGGAEDEAAGGAEDEAAGGAEDEAEGRATDGAVGRGGVGTAGRAEDEAAGRVGVGTAGGAEDGTEGGAEDGTAGRVGIGTAGRADDGTVGGAEDENADRAGDERAGGGDGRTGEGGRGLLRWSRSPAAVLVGVLIGLLGFGIAVQVRSNTSTSGLPAARQEDLVRILDDLSSREARLRRQIADLEAARSRLSTTGDTSSSALQEARTRSDALGILAGTVAAQGPGVVLTMTDPDHRLAAEDLLDTVEELRAAGAEAIQVGGIRIGLDSSFTAADTGIAVDGVAVTVPYTILAIGDPSTLATAMGIPGGVADTAKRAGGEATTEQRQQVVIRALRPVKTPRYSQPTN